MKAMRAAPLSPSEQDVQPRPSGVFWARRATAQQGMCQDPSHPVIVKAIPREQGSLTVYVCAVCGATGGGVPRQPGVATRAKQRLDAELGK